MRKGGCWIFLSHSSNDIAKVRQIRNEFEKQGHNPLAFHLLCLNVDTDDGRYELENLIKREIDAREWFVFCESDAARSSKYVSMEKEYIISTGKKKIWSIDVSLPIDEIVAQVADICRQLKVFISYSRADYEYIRLLENELVSLDFDVWTDQDMLPGRFDIQIESDTNEAANYGFVVVFLSDKYLQSEYCCKYELPKILAKTTNNIILLVIGDVVIPDYLKEIQYYRIPAGISYENMTLIAELIEAETRRKIKGPMNQADAWTKISKINEAINPEWKYHPLEAELVACLGPCDDYCEVYRFPCCGKTVRVGDGPISRFRNDGCHK